MVQNRRPRDRIENTLDKPILANGKCNPEQQVTEEDTAITM